MPRQGHPPRDLARVHAIAIGPLLCAAACFGDPPGVDSAGAELSGAESSGESSGAESSGAESSSEGESADTSDAMCQNLEPPPGCTELLHNNGFDDWATSLPFPTEWQVDGGTATRVDDSEAECPPAMRVHAGAPIEDGHVWTLGQIVSAPTIEVGGRAVFTARVRHVAGAVSQPRICSLADPAPPCGLVTGYADAGWVTISAEFVAEQPLTLHDLTLTSFEPDSEMLVDDLHYWSCPP